MCAEELRLPPGYQLDRSDPDLWSLRWPEGWAVAPFSAQATTNQAIEEMSREDYEHVGEEEYP
jgi:hypothetical protein